jgi:hypothetical protein
MIEVVPCRLEHLRAVGKALRHEERFECAVLGLKPRYAMYGLWKRSQAPRAFLSNGLVLAVGGEVSGTLSLVAQAWLFTTHWVEAVPLSFVRALRSEIDRIMAERGSIVSSVHVDCVRATRLFTMLGFTTEPSPVPGFLNLRLER